MVWPLVGIPQAIAQGMAADRSVFCRDAGFEHVSRYVSGLMSWYQADILDSLQFGRGRAQRGWAVQWCIGESLPASLVGPFDFAASAAARARP